MLAQDNADYNLKT